MSLLSVLMGHTPPRSRRTPPRRRADRLTLTLQALEDRWVPSTVWTQRGGDAGHTAYADVTFDPAALTEAWTRPLGFAQSGTGSWSERAVAIDGTHVYRTDLEGYAPSGTYYVFAFDLQSGTEVWRRTLKGRAFEGVGEPSVAGGVVYVNRAGHSGLSGGTADDLPRLYGFSAATGATVAQTTYSAQWGSNERPVIRDNQLVAWDGYYGGMSAWTASTLGRQWNRSGSIYDNPLAALDDQYVYAYGHNVYQRSTGAFVRAVAHPEGLTPTSPMVGGSGRVFYAVGGSVGGVTKYGVSAYDGDTHAHLWTAPTPSPVGGKAVGNGMVAVTAGPRLILLDEATGAEHSTWAHPSGANLTSEVILTRTHAFVQSSASGVAVVHAIDLATGQEVWRHENRGRDEWGSSVMEMALGGDRLVLSHHLFVKAFVVGDPANQAPDAADDAATTAEDTPVTIAVGANDTDPDGDPLAVMAVGTAANGSVVMNTDGTVKYTPKLNFHGTDSFTYTVGDGRGGTDTATVTVTVTPVNDPPVASTWQYVTDEDKPLSRFLSASDADGDKLTFSIVTPPTEGSVGLVTASGSFTYTPWQDYNGPDSFTFRVFDGQAYSNVATIFVSVRAVNDAPVAQNDSYTTNEDTRLSVSAPGLLGNDADVERQTLSVVITSRPTHGTLDPTSGGGFVYIPNPNFSGTDSFTYQAREVTANGGAGLSSNVATVTITVAAVNDPPVARADGYSVDEDGALSVGAATGVLANDSDVDGGALSASLVRGPAGGALTLNTDGSFAYTPNPNFAGSDVFTYAVSDGNGGTATGTVTITVNPVNDAPAADDKTVATDEDTPQVIAPTGSDVDGDTLTFAIVAGPSWGTVTVNADGTFTYAPAANYHGPDSFAYTASDGRLTSAPATVRITVAAVNDAPVARADAAATDEDTPLTVAAPGVLGNDSDVEGDALSAELVSGPSNGTVTLNPDGSFAYAPNPNFAGVDSFTYRVQEAGAAGLASDAATVTITVNPVNDPPAAVGDSYTVDEDGVLSPGALLGVLANDTDADGDTLTASLVAGPSHGTLALNEDGSFTYTPAADYHGSDEFTYAVSDESGETATGTVAITVDPVNDPPVATPDSYSLGRDASVTVPAAGGVLGNDSDVEGDALTAELVSGPSHGAVTLNPDGSFTYTANTTFHGADSFTYRATDGSAAGAPVTVTITGPLVARIDARQGSSDRIDPSSRTKVAVTIFSADGFDATRDVDIGSLRFGATGDEDSMVRHRKHGTPTYDVIDVNGDGRLDVVVYFDAAKTGLKPGDTTATLRGVLKSGLPLVGTDAVEVASGGGKGNNGKGRK